MRTCDHCHKFARVLSYGALLICSLCGAALGVTGPDGHEVPIDLEPRLTYTVAISSNTSVIAPDTS